MTEGLLLTFYGDDFTGSTDVMEQLEMGGVPTVLFLDIPTPEQLALFPDVKAIGIAGVSRSMTPAQMDAELPDKFAALAQLGAPYFHYKVCSTFDSSPTVGSIGHAIGRLKLRFGQVQLVLEIREQQSGFGEPSMGLIRYLLFHGQIGQLFSGLNDKLTSIDAEETIDR